MGLDADIHAGGQAWHTGETRTAVFLFSPDRRRVVLLRRAPWKAFAPNRWTGIGGRVEAGEAVEAAARRELEEETGLRPGDVGGLDYLALVDDPIGVRLAYFAGTLSREELPACSEGTLHWVETGALSELDIIENTRLCLLDLLAGRVPAGRPARGRFERDARGTLVGLRWYAEHEEP